VSPKTSPKTLTCISPFLFITIDKNPNFLYNIQSYNKPSSRKWKKAGGGKQKMAEIKVNNGNIEDALRRFKRQCVRNGVLQEVRKREHYEKPSVKRKKKSEAARKRKF